MKAIQIVLEEKLLRAADRAAKAAKINRSALFREALRNYLRQRRIENLEHQERIAYERQPLDEFDDWEKVAAWPED